MNGRAVAGKTAATLEHSLQSHAVENQTNEADVSSVSPSSGR